MERVCEDVPARIAGRVAPTVRTPLPQGTRWGGTFFYIPILREFLAGRGFEEEVYLPNQIVGLAWCECLQVSIRDCADRCAQKVLEHIDERGAF